MVSGINAQAFNYTKILSKATHNAYSEFNIFFEVPGLQKRFREFKLVVIILR